MSRRRPACRAPIPTRAHGYRCRLPRASAPTRARAGRCPPFRAPMPTRARAGRCPPFRAPMPTRAHGPSMPALSRVGTASARAGPCPPYRAAAPTRAHGHRCRPCRAAAPTRARAGACGPALQGAGSARTWGSRRAVECTSRRHIHGRVRGQRVFQTETGVQLSSAERTPRLRAARAEPQPGASPTPRPSPPAQGPRVQPEPSQAKPGQAEPEPQPQPKLESYEPPPDARRAGPLPRDPPSAAREARSAARADHVSGVLTSWRRSTRCACRRTSARRRPC
jgi:hypothetical protein